MTQLPINFDISRDPSEHRSRGNELSKAAHDRIVRGKSAIYERILNLIRARGGMTSKELALALGFGAGVARISGRLSEMRYCKPAKVKRLRAEKGRGSGIDDLLNAEYLGGEMSKPKIHFKDISGPVCGSLGSGVSDVTKFREVTCKKCRAKMKLMADALVDFHDFLREATGRR